MKYKEQLLSDIISDAIQKGAPILRWEYSANGKIVIVQRNHATRYCINLFQAADMLIHQYNLMKQYSFIYSKSDGKKPLSVFEMPDNPKIFDNDYESKSIDMCNDLIKSTQDFNVDTKNKMYSIFHKAYGGKDVSKDDFLILRSKLSAYYKDKLSYTQSGDEKNKLRLLNRFLDTMKYKDFLELY